MALLLLLLAFVIGALTVVALEAAGLWILIRRLNRKVEGEEAKAKASASRGVDINHSLHNKQGILWVLEQDKVPKFGVQDKGLTQQRRRKEIVEVTPARKYAKLRDGCLILMEPGGSSVEILLRSCTVAAISATSLSSRKWAKRYPIKVESKGAAIYKGYKTIYIYLETSLEKESWCKVLRLASYDDESKSEWFSKLNVDFRNYLASLNAGYPSFMKPSAGLNPESRNMSVKDNSSMKVRQFLKKLTKKASKSGQDYKASGISASGPEERKISEKSRSFQDSVFSDGLAKMDTTEELPNISSDDTSTSSSIPSSNEPGSRSNSSGIFDADSNHKYLDEGSLCLNVLISRLFFDVKKNSQIKISIQNRIQRALSNMRIPNYVGEVTCTDVNPGTLPPRILAMRVLPSDMNELWSIEIDIEYLGGTILDFKTRLEIQELELEGEKTHFDTNTNDEVTSDMLEDFKYLGKHLKLPEETIADIKQKDEGYHDSDETAENSKSTVQASSQGSRWKSILHSITKQVSQVPFSLGIRVSSLSGTIRLCMKPPPSDQIWFGFTSMPDIQLNLESSVGDHKITNGHLALFLISRFKAAIRETLVLPNSESISIPWMLAEKDDWLPRKAAPFMWYRNDQDSSSTASKQEAPNIQPDEVIHVVEANHGNPTRSEVNHEKSKNMSRVPEEICESSDPGASSSSSIDESTMNDNSFHELKAPLLKKDAMQELGSRSMDNKSDSFRMDSPSRVFTEGQVRFAEDDDTRPRRIGTRERMFGLGKKVGEKLEVKRRHFEEKGRSFVERMRAP